MARSAACLTAAAEHRSEQASGSSRAAALQLLNWLLSKAYINECLSV